MGKKIKKAGIKELFPAVSLSLAISFLFFIYGPLEILFTNKYEFTYSSLDVFCYMIPVFLTAVFFLTGWFCFLRFKQIKMYRFVMILLFITFIAVYIQGTFFTSNLPELDGREIRWENYKSGRYVSLLIWFSVLFLVIIIYRYKKQKIEDIIKIISICIFSLLFTTILIMGFSADGFHGNKDEINVSKSYLYDMSSKRNLIVFLIDAVDADTFQQVLDVHPDYNEDFRDFTFYSNVTSGYPYTSRSIPFILSGKWYENEESFYDYCNKAVSESPLFKKLIQENFRMGLYYPDLSFLPVIEDVFENVSGDKMRFVYPDRFIKMQIMLTGYRYLPFDIKKFCYLTPENLYVDAVKSNGLEGFYRVDNDSFVEELDYGDINITDDKCFKFIYIRGAHEPFTYESISPQIEDFSYESNIEKSMSVADAYIRKLKESSVFDDSAIVFLSDHGFADGNIPFGRQNPFLMIKGIDEHHAFNISDISVCHEELQDAFIKLADGVNSSSLFDKDGSKERRFLFYNYGKEETIWEYYQTGHASDESTMIETGKVYQYAENKKSL